LIYGHSTVILYNLNNIADCAEVRGRAFFNIRKSLVNFI
jgi:hypothetical protein